MIGEAARQTSEQVELDEGKKEEIGKRIDILLHMDNDPSAQIIYFVQDEKKLGGKYESADGKITKYDSLSRTITLDSGIILYIDDIVDVKADCFDT